MSYENYPEKWQKRFHFFDENGSPGAPGYKEKIKSLKEEKGFWEVLTINMNFFAFFFGFIYLFILGLWKKALVMIGVTIVFWIIIGILEAVIGVNLNPAGIALALLYGMTTNYAYYLKEVKGQDGWNPFEGLRW